MNRNAPTGGFLCLAAATLAWLLCGCGSPGAPQPPSLQLPTPVTNLSAARIVGSVHLAWTVPTRTTDHLALHRPLKVQVCRALEEGPCAGIASLTLKPGAAGVYVDRLPPDLLDGANRLLRYEISLPNHAGKSAGSSNPAYAAAGTAPAPVTGVSAGVLAEGVQLRWQQVPEPGKFIIFRIARLQLSAPPVNPESRPSPLALPTPAALQTLEVRTRHGNDPGQAIDTSVLFNQKYRYVIERIERVSLSGERLEVQGAPSEPIEVTTTDVFPPGVPQGLAAVQDSSAATIDLSWLPDMDTDLATYRIYRRDVEGGSSQLIASPGVETAFRDTHVQPGHTYAYSVSAVDRNGNESRRSAEVEETLSKP